MLSLLEYRIVNPNLHLDFRVWSILYQTNPSLNHIGSRIKKQIEKNTTAA